MIFVFLIKISLIIRHSLDALLKGQVLVDCLYTSDQHAFAPAQTELVSTGSNSLLQHHEQMLPKTTYEQRP